MTSTQKIADTLSSGLTAEEAVSFFSDPEHAVKTPERREFTPGKTIGQIYEDKRSLNENAEEVSEIIHQANAEKAQQERSAKMEAEVKQERASSRYQVPFTELQVNPADVEEFKKTDDTLTVQEYELQKLENNSEYWTKLYNSDPQEFERQQHLLSESKQVLVQQRQKLLAASQEYAQNFEKARQQQYLQDLHVRNQNLKSAYPELDQQYRLRQFGEYLRDELGMSPSEIGQLENHGTFDTVSRKYKKFLEHEKRSKPSNRKVRLRKVSKPKSQRTREERQEALERETRKEMKQRNVRDPHGMEGSTIRISKILSGQY